MPASTTAVTQVAIEGLPLLRSGKVREVYDLGERLLLVATDRVSAFDVVMPNGIPDKGKILNQLSAFWFRKLEHITPHHMISIDDEEIGAAIGKPLGPELRGRCMLAHKCEPILIESVARAFLAGSLYKEYVAAGGNERDVEIHGLRLPMGLVLCDELPETIYTPATKAQTGHDENISFDEAAAIAGADVLSQCKVATLRIFNVAHAICRQAGILLADTKFEFGIRDGSVVLIDEVLTPDSSRFWPISKYAPGHPQESLDKQYIRDYLETLSWNKQPPGPELPASVVTGTRHRYIEIFETITGESPRL